MRSSRCGTPGCRKVTRLIADAWPGGLGAKPGTCGPPASAAPRWSPHPTPAHACPWNLCPHSSAEHVQRQDNPHAKAHACLILSAPPVCNYGQQSEASARAPGGFLCPNRHACSPRTCACCRRPPAHAEGAPMPCFVCPSPSQPCPANLPDIPLHHLTTCKVAIAMQSCGNRKAESDGTTKLPQPHSACEVLTRCRESALKASHSGKLACPFQDGPAQRSGAPARICCAAPA